MRVDSPFRSWLSCTEAQLTELVCFIGKLTHAANSWVDTEGNKRRDSDAAPKRKRRGVRAPRKVKVERSSASSANRTKSPVPGEWLHAWLRSRGRGGCERASPQHRPSKQALVRRSVVCFTERQEASFQDWWRESCSQRLQPRDPSLPSASQRLEALKLRLTAKQGRAME